ncbi:glycosyl transferase [Massilia sp. CCM 8692]|uniref:Dictomallein n=1 Tax=Massilia rubra TaxID=2607910 RepID=A0ABX0LFN9_9BURK|nr:glycosyl transferase [Massilia rubra]
MSFPEPNSAIYDRSTALAFYDTTANGQPRALRKDLQGAFGAMVQFVQSHVVNPSGNEALNLPRLTTERDALLLITPDGALGNVEALQLTVTVDGAAKPLLAMRAPQALFAADRSGADERPDVVYSHKAWSVVLPWNWVKPGMTLSVRDDKGRTGALGAAAIDFAAPAELVIASIQLGMLTDPPASSGHYMLTDAAAAATDYFQTVPVSKLTVAAYEPMKLSRVMVSSGVIYDTASATSGDVYGGDMRADTAKSTFSTGINMANWGVTSSNMQSQNQPHITQAATIHHARGKYTNGLVTHGLSGGNGILTLIDSVGNEFSHEIGHHYGLGHYPGQVGTNCFDCAHHHDSGWGFIANRNHMRANLNWGSKSLGDGANGVPNFAKLYPFGWDAMAGGFSSSSMSRYTHYTGYSTKQKIQPALNKAVFSADSPTGYRKWNATTRAMENTAPAVPGSSTEWYNSGAKFAPPRKHGVPVWTILGGYDPVAGVGLLYPAARGNWGNTFELPPPAATAAARQCWLSVDYAGAASKKIALAANRMGVNANKLHVQLAQDEQPTQAKLFCQEAGAAARELSSIAIPGNLPAMAPAVRVGREFGYAALRKAEMPRFQSALLALAGNKVLTLDTKAALLFDSYADGFANELSGAARAQLERYQAQNDVARRLNRWMFAYAAKLDQQDPAARSALLALIEKLGLQSTPQMPVAQLLKNGTNCLKTETVGGAVQLMISNAAGCSGQQTESWVQDAVGRIRSGASLDQCLTDMGGSNRVTLSTCNPRADTQVWDTTLAGAVRRGSRCFDLSGGYLTNGRGNLITYNCTGNANQKWTGLTMSDNLLLPLTDAANVKNLPLK